MTHSLRALYTTVLIVIVMLIFLFIGSLVFFDKTNHTTLYYDTRLNNQLIGTCKIDRFSTEDRIIFKQVSDMPFDPIYTTVKTRIVFDKKYILDSFIEERSTDNGLTSLICLEAKNAGISFLARSQSRVTCIDGMPGRKDVFVFQDDQPVSYLPIIENYDFQKGRAQGFHALSFPSQLLPPAKRYVTLTSIRDEYLKIDGRKIKAENLILKIRNYPQGSIWVAKSDRKLLMVDLPMKGIRITRRFHPVELTAIEPPLVMPPYAVRDVSITAQSAELSGTLTIPAASGTYPAVLLIPGDGPCTRDYFGLYASLADTLTANGFCTLRFDKRGMGKSSADAAWPLTTETVQDIQAAIRFLAEQPEVSGDKIVLIAHGDGALPAALAALAETQAIGGIIFMSPSLYGITDFETHPELLTEAATRNQWNADYQKLVDMASRQTRERAITSKFGWAYILGKRCFLAEMKQRCMSDPLARATQLTIPTLIIQGANDRSRAIESASALDRALEAAGNKTSNLVYFENLGYFLGNMVADGECRIHYTLSPDAGETIRAWLNKIVAAGRTGRVADPAPSPDLKTGPQEKGAAL